MQRRHTEEPPSQRERAHITAPHCPTEPPSTTAPYSPTISDTRRTPDAPTVDMTRGSAGNVWSNQQEHASESATVHAFSAEEDTINENPHQDHEEDGDSRPPSRPTWMHPRHSNARKNPNLDGLQKNMTMDCFRESTSGLHKSAGMDGLHKSASMDGFSFASLERAQLNKSYSTKTKAFSIMNKPASVLFSHRAKKKTSSASRISPDNKLTSSSSDLAACQSAGAHCAREMLMRQTSLLNLPLETLKESEQSHDELKEDWNNRAGSSFEGHCNSFSITNHNAKNTNTSNNDASSCKKFTPLFSSFYNQTASYNAANLAISADIMLPTEDHRESILEKRENELKSIYRASFIANESGILSTCVSMYVCMHVRVCMIVCIYIAYSIATESVIS